MKKDKTKKVAETTKTPQKPVSFDEFVTRIVRVKPPTPKPKK
jgi:hypothetical protein